jgi:hypothetical protein
MDSQNQEHDNHAKASHSEPKSQLDGLEGIFDTYLREKAPFQFPAKVREWIVKYGPWISLVLLILTALVVIPGLFIILGLTAVTLPYQAMGTVKSMGPIDYLAILISLAVLVMEAMAIPALLKRKLSGWKLVYYASLLSIVSSLLTGAIVSAILSLVIGMYILFQIRSYYK